MVTWKCKALFLLPRLNVKTGCVAHQPSWMGLVSTAEWTLVLRCLLCQQQEVVNLKGLSKPMFHSSGLDDMLVSPSAESKLLSWTLYRAYQLGMAGLPAQPYGCWDDWVQLCLYLTCLQLTCLHWGLYGQSWWVLPASSIVSMQKGEHIVAVKSACLPSTTQALSKGPVFPLLQPERKFSSGTTLSSKCSKLQQTPWHTLQHRELKAARGIKVP